MNTQSRGQRGPAINTRECQTKENIIKIMIRDRAKPRVAGYNQREEKKRESQEIIYTHIYTYTCCDIYIPFAGKGQTRVP